MCLKVRVVYRRCAHVHLGCELCNNTGPDNICCSRVETHLRVDPFCPLCSRQEYRAYKLQSTLRAHLDPTIQTRTMVLARQSQLLQQIQPQERPVLNSPLHPSLNLIIPPPSPVEPSFDPTVCVDLWNMAKKYL
jgi:hypothetical protein